MTFKWFFVYIISVVVHRFLELLQVKYIKNKKNIVKRYIPIYKNLTKLSEINNKVIPEALKNISEILFKNNIIFVL